MSSYRCTYIIRTFSPENVDHSSSSYLDLQIDVDDKQFDFKLFDKRDAFPFSVVRMPHLQSNMPSKMFYSTISAEILRICRATFKYSNFLLICAYVTQYLDIRSLVFSKTLDLDRG